MRFRNNLFLRKLLAWGINLVYGLCFVALWGLLAQLLLVTSFKIPSDSMEPSLLAGDYILVDKCSKGARLFDVFAALERKEVKIHRMPGWREFKRNDVLVFNPYTAWDGNAAELASLLKIDKEAVAEMKSNFSFQVEEITRFVEGEVNQEIFDQVFGKDVVKSEEEFRAKVKEVIANQFVADGDYKFLLDVRKMLMEKVGKLEFPDALLKRIMRLNNQDKDEKFVEDNYDKSIEELTWHLIKEQLVKANDIKVEQDDILNMAKEATRAQFAQYGMLSVPEEILDNYAKEMLKKKESIEGLVNRVVETKLASALKTQVKLENKNISAEDFNKMFE